MFADDALHRCQANTVPGELFCTVKALKWGEQFGSVIHIETGTVILYVINRLFIFGERPEADMGMMRLSGIFPSVSICLRPESAYTQNVLDEQ